MTAKPANESRNAGTPNQTLFVKNLPEKINKNELKRALYMLFSTYGPVLDIVTSRVGAKGQHMRGQAHVVFRDIQTSTQAMRALQGFDFFGREMVRVDTASSVEL
jgi:RNA recognition motif-containing protein